MWISTWITLWISGAISTAKEAGNRQKGISTGLYKQNIQDFHCFLPRKDINLLILQSNVENVDKHCW